MVCVLSGVGFKPGSSLECIIEHTQPLRPLSHHGLIVLQISDYSLINTMLKKVLRAYEKV